MERDLGTQLLERTTRGVRPTPAGKQLLELGGRITSDLDMFRRDLLEQAQGISGHLRIGTGLAPALHLLPVTCARLIATTPGLTFEIYSGTSDKLIPLLQEGKLDVVLAGVKTPAVSSSLEQVAVLNDRAVVVGRAKHPLMRNGSRLLKPSQLARAQWALSDINSSLTSWLERRFGELNLGAPNAIVRSDSALALLSIIAHSNLLTFMSWSSVKRSKYESAIAPFRCQSVEWNRVVTATYRRQGYVPRVLPRFLDALKSTASSDLQAER
jgi:DNA-binding transcriptional LysR family regulator